MFHAKIVDPSGVTLVGGGPVGARDLNDSLARAPLLVAADGGADRALEAGHAPAWIVGDLDSVSAQARAAVPASRLVHDPDQETNDLQKCLARISAPFVLGLGFLGGRVDHTLAAFNALVRHDGAPLVLIGERDVCFHAGRGCALDLSAGTRLSLFPMRALRGSSRGLVWPVDGLDFAPGGTIGTSNRSHGHGPVQLSFENPGMVVILPRPALGAVLSALC